MLVRISSVNFALVMLLAASCGSDQSITQYCDDENLIRLSLLHATEEVGVGDLAISQSNCAMKDNCADGIYDALNKNEIMYRNSGSINSKRALIDIVKVDGAISFRISYKEREVEYKFREC